MMPILFGLTLIAASFSFGCATAVKIDTSKTGDVLVENPVQGITRIKHRVVHVENKDNLRNMVLNRRNYRIDFYKQSKDPYFNRDRWSERCIRQNKMGDLQDSADGSFFTTLATADQNLKTEICNDSSIDAFQIVGECRKQGLLYDVTVTGPRASEVRYRCPDELVVPK